MPRTLVARIVVAVLIGVLVGVAVGKSVQHDYDIGKNLTMKEYIADFDKHKEDLMKGNLPMEYAIIGGTIMVVAVFGLYEVLVFAVDRLFGAFGKRREESPR